MTATTAFLVVIDAAGNAVAYSDLAAPEVTRAATLADMRRGCFEVLADIASASAADVVMERLHPAKPQPAQAIKAALNERRSA